MRESDVCDMGMPRERVKALLLCATVGCLDMLDRIPIECKKYDGDGVKCMAQCLIIHYSESSVSMDDAPCTISTMAGARGSVVGSRPYAISRMP